MTASHKKLSLLVVWLEVTGCELVGAWFRMRYQSLSDMLRPLKTQAETLNSGPPFPPLLPTGGTRARGARACSDKQGTARGRRPKPRAGDHRAERGF